MPILDLGDWNAGINKYTCHCLWATMCFPDELSSRQQYLNKKVIEWRGGMRDSVKKPIEQALTEIKGQETFPPIEGLINEGFKKYLLRTGGDQVTLNALSQDKSIDSIERNSFYKGFTAGLVLIKILQLDKHHEDGGSVNKAFYLVEKQYKGKDFSRSSKTIKNAWKDYKTVSHLWAAAYCLLHEFDKKNEFMVIEWLESDIPNNLLQLLQYAEYFRNFGENHFSNKATKTPTLDPQKSWVFPEKFPIQEQSLKVPKLQNWEKEAMSKYKAPTNRP